jgi:hypothetical protein
MSPDCCLETEGLVAAPHLQNLFPSGIDALSVLIRGWCVWNTLTVSCRLTIWKWKLRYTSQKVCIWIHIYPLSSSYLQIYLQACNFHIIEFLPYSTWQIHVRKRADVSSRRVLRHTVLEERWYLLLGYGALCVLFLTVSSVRSDG